MLECVVAYCRGVQLLCRSNCPCLQFRMIRSIESAQNEVPSTSRESLIDDIDLMDEAVRSRSPQFVVQNLA